MTATGDWGEGPSYSIFYAYQQNLKCTAVPNTDPCQANCGGSRGNLSSMKVKKFLKKEQNRRTTSLL
jgi:hypothetical protein